jgi:hypothetical protein
MPDKYKPYFTFRQWTATGEGLTFQFMICGSKTPDGAKKKHIGEFMGTLLELGSIGLSEPSLDYVKSQIVAYPLRIRGKLNKKVERILFDFFKPEMVLYVRDMVEQKSLMSLKFESYANLS